jgi:D-glycero-alpha-D-manno-heptose-7-phosphate kinase
MDKYRKEALEGNLMMFYTGINRFASEVLKEQIQKTQEKKIHTELTDIHSMVDEGLAIISDTNRSLDDFGRLMHRGWMAKRSLSSAISNSFLDDIYDKATNAGALGGKLLGAGGGGFFVFYVPHAAQSDVRSALKEYKEINFSFENEGTRIVHMS